MDNLKGFLEDDTVEPATETPVAETAVVEPIVEPVDPVETKAEPTAEPEPPEGTMVPVKALQAERRERQDWKEKATRFEERERAAVAETERLKVELATARTMPVPVPTQAPQQAYVPNPLEDPVGHANWLQNQRLEDRLNMSEAMLKQENLPDMQVAIEAFKTAATANPALAVQLRTEVHPFRYAYTEGKRLMALSQIGADPDAWRTAERERLRAEIAAEMNTAAPIGASPVALPSSLSGARSVGARTAEADTEIDFDAIFQRKRK